MPAAATDSARRLFNALLNENRQGVASLDYWLDLLATAAENGEISGGGGGGSGTVSVAVENAMWGPGIGSWPALVISTFTLALDDADDAAAAVCIAPRSGTIDRIAFPVCTRTGTPPAYNVGLTTVDAVLDPTQVPLGVGSTQEHTFAAATVIEEITLDAPVAVVAGAQFAVHIWPTGTAPDGSNSIVIIVGYSGEARVPAIRTFSTSWVARNVTWPAIAYRFDDGEWVGVPIVPVVSQTIFDDQTVAFDSADSPDEHGAVFSVPFGAVCSGVRLRMDAPATGNDVTIHLYDAADVELRAVTLASAWQTSVGTWDVTWPTPIALAAAASYRITVTNGSGTATMRFFRFNVGDGDRRSCLPEGARWQHTSRTNAGAWTDAPTLLPVMAVVLDEVSLAYP